MSKQQAPDHADESRWRTQPVTVTLAGTLTPVVQRMVSDQYAENSTRAVQGLVAVHHAPLPEARCGAIAALRNREKGAREGLCGCMARNWSPQR